jgi:hypothetical protein
MTQEVTGKNDTTSEGSSTPKARETKSLKYREADRGLWEVYFEGGGDVPAAVSGKFTSMTEARNAIMRFYEQKAAKVLANTRGYRRVQSSSN